MTRKVSNKIYQYSLYALGFFVLFNIVGIWVFWCCDQNPFGYVTGALLLVSLITSGCLSFFNEKPSVRKQWIVWLICLCFHLIFFILESVIQDESYAIPALFTVMVVAIGAAVVYFIFRNKITLKNKPYKLTETVPNEGTSQDVKSDTDVVQKTVRIQVDQEVDKTPVANFEEPKTEYKQKDEPKEESSNEPSGVITL